MKHEVTLIIADDHPVFRKGLADVLKSDFKIAAEAENGVEAVEMIERFKPEVAILDIDMPKMSGFDVMKEIQIRGLEVSVIVLTMYNEEKMFNKALDLGARGYILKESAVIDIRNGVEAVSEGKYYISPLISGYLVKRFSGTNFVSNTGLDKLTQSEWRILKLISGNKTSKEIAEELFISINTVENHRAHICRKLNISGNNALIRFALENKEKL